MSICAPYRDRFNREHREMMSARNNMVIDQRRYKLINTDGTTLGLNTELLSNRADKSQDQDKLYRMSDDNESLILRDNVIVNQLLETAQIASFMKHREREHRELM